MIINLIRDEKPTHIATAFDVSRKTFRTEKFPEYKANRATTYTKTEVDNSLLLIANQSTSYAKTEVDNSLLLNANQSTTYNKTEVDNRL